MIVRSCREATVEAKVSALKMEISSDKKFLLQIAR
jgi:hypothetical protein